MTREEYAAYLLTPYWRGLSRIMKELADHRCQICGASQFRGVTLEVHHNTYERVPYREHLSDLVVLCDDCHGIFRKRMETRK